MGLFGFYDMANNYKDRVVANDEVNGAVIDTAAVTDSAFHYETGITHGAYNCGGWIIVEVYNTKKEALVGHKQWVEKFTGKLPKSLKDVNTCEIAKFAKAFGVNTNKTHKRRK